jgi:hypothetical protein
MLARMADGPHPDLDVFSTGWMRILPEPAFRALSALLWLRANPTAGDLDELAAEGLLCLGDLGGLDVRFRPDGRMERAEDEALWTARWRRFRAFALARGLPMDTPRDAIALLRAIGLAERVERDDGVFWRSAAPVPLAEDVLELTAQEREREARLRWLHAFAAAEQRITTWLAGRRDAAAPKTTTSTIRTTLQRLAAQLGLDVDDARFGLANLAAEAGDVACEPHPEDALPGQAIAIVVDWRIFAVQRAAFVVQD